MNQNIKYILRTLPSSPGIYQFFDIEGNIIYVGKSVNLKSRINSYFNGKSKLNFAKQKMVDLISDIKVIITNNETESLILETTLIKKYQPKYNILMKDGKNHIYIKIASDIIPKIIKTRRKNKTGIFFGPYTSTNYVNNIFKFLKKHFGYRSCNIIFKKEKSKIIIESTGGIKVPCMDYYIKRCNGPCLLDQIIIDDYYDNIEKIKMFLKGNTQEIIKILESKMLEKAKELKFEEAGKIKNDIESIKSLNINQIVREGVVGNYNVVNIIEKFEKNYIGMIEIRDSKITGFYNYDIKNNLNESKELILQNFIETNYVDNNNLKIIYLTPFNLDLNSQIKYEVPKIGTKLELLDLCYKNIYEYAYKSHLNSLSAKGFSKQTMINLLNILGYNQINNDLIFECNDISHISGNFTVASRSIIVNGKSVTNKYKKFKIKALNDGKIDDFASMQEIITRRVKELEKLKNFPDLVIIDGGKGQLSSVAKIIKENNIDLQLISIAKKEEEIYLPGVSKPIILDKNSNELKLIQKIRDEAHRFAISFNRSSRIKAMKKNILEELPGFGLITRKKLLKKYGNIDKLKDVEVGELAKILNKNQIQTLQDHGLIE